MEELESYFYWYYYSIGENIQKKEYIEASLDRQDVKDIKSIGGLTIPRKETPYYCFILANKQRYIYIILDLIRYQIY